MSKKILIIVRGKFPTERAYGVTTLATYQSLKDMGYQCNILCLKPDSMKPIIKTLARDLIFIQENRLASFIKKFSFKGTGIFNILAWNIFLRLTESQIRLYINSWKPDLIWCRDKPIKFDFHNHSSQPTTVVEFHEIPPKRLLRRIDLDSKNKYLFAPISKVIQRALPKSTEVRPVILSPMGVASRFDSVKNESRQFFPNHNARDVIRLGYFGRIRPNGYSKGTEDIFALAEFHRDMRVDTEFWFVGVSTNELVKMKKEIETRGLSERIFLHAYVPHDEALSLMQEFDILILTVAKFGDYHGFPLKALEYARSGARVLAADAPVNRDVFSGTYQPYWFKPGDIQDFNRAFEESVVDPNHKKNVIAAMNFANEFTWEARTKKIIEHLEF